MGNVCATDDGDGDNNVEEMIRKEERAQRSPIGGGLSGLAGGLALYLAEDIKASKVAGHAQVTALVSRSELFGILLEAQAPPGGRCKLRYSALLFAFEPH